MPYLHLKRKKSPLQKLTMTTQHPNDAILDTSVTTRQALVPPLVRLDIVDALRGFSLIGIAIVHFMEQYLGGPPPASIGNYTQHLPPDGVLDTISFILIRGKFFALFSFLFGLSFALQMERSEVRTGKDFRLRFAWRLVILFGIGLLHHLIYRGDILTIFAMLGLPLLLFYKIPDKWVFIITIILMLGVPRFILYTTGYEPFKSYVPDWNSKQDDPEVLTHWNAAKSGDWATLATINLTDGFPMKMNFQFGSVGRAYQTFAWFLLGLLAGRRRFFENFDANRSLIRQVFKWSIISFFSTIALAAAIFIPFGKTMPESLQFLIGNTMNDLNSIAMTLFYITAFMILFHREKWQRRLGKLAPFGRMALTNYVTQTLIGATILFGFGLLGSIGNSITLPIAIAVIILQIWWSKVWLRHFNYGPLEWLWRSLTWFKWQNFRKEKVV